MARDIAGGVKNIEVEAERILEEARGQADEILVRAKQEAKQILSSELPMDEVKPQCEETIGKAREQADQEMKSSQRRASEIGANADKKVEEVVKLMVSIITGARSA